MCFKVYYSDNSSVELNETRGIQIHSNQCILTVLTMMLENKVKSRYAQALMESSVLRITVRWKTKVSYIRHQTKTDTFLP